MDISTANMQAAASQNALSMGLMRRSLDLQQDAATRLLDALPKPQPLNPRVGGTVDARL
jgi:hypothetical protein